MKTTEIEGKGEHMLMKFKSALLMFVCLAVLVQLGGCIFVKHDHPRHHDSDREHADLDIHVH